MSALLAWAFVFFLFAGAFSMWVVAYSFFRFFCWGHWKSAILASLLVGFSYWASRHGAEVFYMLLGRP